MKEERYKEIRDIVYAKPSNTDKIFDDLYNEIKDDGVLHDALELKAVLSEYFEETPIGNVEDRYTTVGIEKTAEMLKSKINWAINNIIDNKVEHAIDIVVRRWYHNGQK